MLRMRAGDRRRREAVGATADDVVPTEFAHPSKLVDRADEAAAIVAAVMLAFVVLALIVLVLEAIVVALVAVVVVLFRLLWGRWRCEVIAPDGQRVRFSAGSLSAIRARAALACDSIRQRGRTDELVA
jgi:hypothetical protein